MKTLFLYWHTLRHLKFVQLYYRVVYAFITPKIKLNLELQKQREVLDFIKPIEKPVRLEGDSIFRFLNCTGDLKLIGWNGPQRSKLWRYNQHYFDYLGGSQELMDNGTKIINRWINENSPSYGIGWEPYPTSLRIVNWIKWALNGNKLPEEVLKSLVLQSFWLSQRIEWHLQGNHLIANAKALIFVGSFLSGQQADKWLNLGEKILQHQLDEQILNDGGHFELSPMYHSIVLEDLLDVINIYRTYKIQNDSFSYLEAENKCAKVIPKMINWLYAMSHPDGEISFFNDAAFGIAPKPAVLFEYANRLNFATNKLNRGIQDFCESGYTVLSNSNFYLIADLAAIGPDYIPAHAHADSLSIELSIGKYRVFVNSGVSTYEAGPERCYQRSTKAHNTAEIAFTNSSEIWSSFRVGRRAKVTRKKINGEDDCISVSGVHNGYNNLCFGLAHMRTIQLCSQSLQIEDSVTKSGFPAVVRYFVHPSISIKSVANEACTLELPNKKTVTIQILGSKDVRATSVDWFPKFGVKIPTKCLEIVISDQKCNVSLQFSS